MFFALLIGAAVLAFVIFILTRIFHVVAQYERAIVFRFGKFVGVKGPGLIVLVPFVDTIEDLVDTRATNVVVNIDVLTRDTVSVKVEAIVFYRVVDAAASTLNVDGYEDNIDHAAQVALRNAIGAADLSTVLSDRTTIDAHVQASIAAQAKAWGVEVQSVDINDVTLPEGLNDAMSQGAQAQREAAARIMLADSETVIAAKFIAAAKVYESDPVALDLRRMNLTFEAIKNGEANTVLFPSSALDGLVSGAKALVK